MTSLTPLAGGRDGPLPASASSPHIGWQGSPVGTPPAINVHGEGLMLRAQAWCTPAAASLLHLSAPGTPPSLFLLPGKHDQPHLFFSLHKPT